MRFKDYVWPHNPRTFEASASRRLSAVRIPFGGYTLTDLGPDRRLLSGEGEFTGAGAYTEFKRLERVFKEGGAGILVHPVWGAVSAHFAALSLKQEPFSDYVRYAFEFWEDA